MRSSDFGTVVGRYADGGSVEAELEDIKRLLRQRLMRSGKSTPVPGSTTADTMANAFARGAVTSGAGVLGDLEGLGRGAVGLASGGLEGALQGLDAATLLPSSKDVGAGLDRLGWSEPTGPGAGPGEFVGSMVGFSPGVSAMRKLLAKRAAARRAAEMRRLDEYAPGFFRGGRVRRERDELDDELDAAYAQLKLETS